MSEVSVDKFVKWSEVFRAIADGCPSEYSRGVTDTLDAVLVHLEEGDWEADTDE